MTADVDGRAKAKMKLARRTRGDLFFLGSSVFAFAEANGIEDEARLCERLGLPGEYELASLCLCRRPGRGDYASCVRIAGHCGCPASAVSWLTEWRVEEL